MKQCPKGHIYPDPLVSCPVCDQKENLQTTIRGLDQKENKKLKKWLAISNPESDTVNRKIHHKYEDTNAEADINSKYDDDRTIVIKSAKKRLSKYLTGWLVELNADDQPIKSYQLSNKKISIGRKEDNDIILETKLVSRHHCFIEYQDGKFVLHDNDSTNKIKVDENPVESCSLKENHLISIGNKKFIIKYL